MNQSCILAWSKISLLKNHSFFCCLADTKSDMGKRYVSPNINNKFLSDVWNSDLYQNTRKNMIEKGIVYLCFLNAY